MHACSLEVYVAIAIGYVTQLHIRYGVYIIYGIIYDSSYMVAIYNY